MKGAVEIPSLRSKLSWTVSHWYVTAHCLLAHSEIGNRGREQGRGFACRCWGGGSSVCQTTSWLSQKPWEGLQEEEEQSQWKVQPSAGLRGKKLTVPEQSINSPPPPSPTLLPRVGRIRASPAGAHSLQLWSAAALSNTRQHLQPLALKRPKIPIRERTACLPSIVQDRTGQNCVSSWMGGFKMPPLQSCSHWFVSQSLSP